MAQPMCMLLLVTFKEKILYKGMHKSLFIQLNPGDMAKYCGGSREEFGLCIQIANFLEQIHRTLTDIEPDIHFFLVKLYCKWLAR